LAVAVAPEGTELVCQWFRGTKFLSQASGVSYVVQAADAGEPIVVKVTASRAGSVSAVRYSNTVTVAEPIKVTKKELPATAAVGATVTLDLEFTPVDADVEVQWFRGSSWIAGASGVSYVVAPADSGGDVVAKIVVSKEGYDSVTVYSTRTVVSGPVAPAVKSAVLSPAAPVVGEAVTLSTVIVPEGAAVKYEWFQGTSLLRSGGLPVTGTAYTPTAADVGKDLVVKITVTVEGFTPVVKYTNRVIIAPAP
jgi:hypothetical protein